MDVYFQPEHPNRESSKGSSLVQKNIMNVEVQVDQITSEQWEICASTFTDNNIYQSWVFSKHRAAEMKAAVSRLVVKRDDTVIGMAQVRIKKIPILGAGVAYVFRGPLWQREKAAPDDFRAVLQALHKEYAQRRGLEVRVVPPLPQPAADEHILYALQEFGFSRDESVTAYHTFLLDMSPSLEKLRSSLDQKWRNHLNKAQRNPLTVISDTNDKAFADFQQLYDSMKLKKQFDSDVSIESYRRMQPEFSSEEKLTIWLAISDGHPTAGHVTSMMGDTCVSILGASNDEGRKLRAAYLLQWAIIEQSKQKGARWYDLGGIDPINNPGVYSFKAGFRGQDCTFIGQFRTPGRGVGKFLLPWLERVYKLFRSRWRKIIDRPVKSSS